MSALTIFKAGMPVTIITAAPARTVEFTDLTSSAVQTFAHKLNRIPLILTTALVCVTNDFYSGMVAGQQIKLSSFYDPNVGIAAISIVCDTTNFYMSFPGALTGGCSINWNGVNTVPAISNFKVVVTYR